MKNLIELPKNTSFAAYGPSNPFHQVITALQAERNYMKRTLEGFM
ncbi:hypothetical protein M7I_2549 [Glarea lozoyensis 74030]|uniref:Uncharacterized protein n=1 Tax=Glarea lozoyensis (strain ATCC 74030 / MF5533) TaxID=1104152 RepID=H0EJ26_GLAL7|nr:hypothetical protein M7I_2549 [Glarea lozoyensis 74030]